MGASLVTCELPTLDSVRNDYTRDSLMLVGEGREAEEEAGEVGEEEEGVGNDPGEQRLVMSPME